jgi:two-component system phosphate regulon response regulator PhoB
VAACILVVEDDPAIRELIGVTLSGAGHAVLKAGDTESALRLIRDTLPHMVLLDWQQPDGSGLELARRLRADERTRRVALIMLTARCSEEDRVAGLEAGLDDYITKPFSPREMLARVKSVIRRRAPHTLDETVEICGLRLDPRTRRVTAGNVPVRLGGLEFRLLHFLMTHPGCVLTRTDLLDQIWGDDAFIEERTVDVRVRRLRACLEASGFDELIQTVRGTGYRLSPELFISAA